MKTSKERLRGLMSREPRLRSLGEAPLYAKISSGLSKRKLKFYIRRRSLHRAAMVAPLKILSSQRGETITCKCVKTSLIQPMISSWKGLNKVTLSRYLVKSKMRAMKISWLSRTNWLQMWISIWSNFSRLRNLTNTNKMRTIFRITKRWICLKTRGS